MSVGVAVVTYNRPSYLEAALHGIKRHLVDHGLVDRVYVVDDGSDDTFRQSYIEMARSHRWSTFIALSVNGGVGKAKNVALRLLMGEGHKWLFLSEDDVIVESPMAVLGYIASAVNSRLHHLSFHGHGPANPAPTGVLQTDGTSGAVPVTLWPNSVGAWALFTAECLRTCGLMDEEFTNAWEHVEHTMRLGEAGFTSEGMGRFADASGSEAWIREIPGAIESSVIRQRGDHQTNLRKGLHYWREAHPETYRWVAHLFEPSSATNTQSATCVSVGR